MNDSDPARTAARPPQPTILIAMAAVIAAVIGVVGYPLLAASSPSATRDARAQSIPATSATVVRQTGDVPQLLPPRDLPPPLDRPRIAPRHTDHQRALGEADGVLPDGVTVFDDGYPGVANLEPDLLQALRDAATAAADDGVAFSLTSGWRSPGYQDRLLHEAVSAYGSEAEAARWVATADASPHVSGDAVDIGPVDATAWLSDQGAEYGLCQIYVNEPWHYELRPEAADRGCLPMYADPTHDPRMQP